MKYAVMTTWHHGNGLDDEKWEKMENDIMGSSGPESPEGTVLNWFQIDENSHGSVVIFPSQEAYEAFAEEMGAYRRKTRESMDINMTFEAKGPIKVSI